MKEDAVYVLFSILRSVFYGIPLSAEEKRTISNDMLSDTLKLAAKYDLAHLVAYSIMNSDMADDSDMMQIKAIAFKAVHRYERTKFELDQVCETLENEKIAFIPLKGSVINEHYPEPWMRTSCDIDILVHEADLEKAVSALTSELQYTADDKKNYHDVSLHSPNGIHLELHFNIQENIETLDRVLSRVWQYAKPVEKMEFRYEMTNEFLLFHIVTHMSYHFVTGGCGIRPVIDLWLLLNALHLDQSELDTLLADANLTQFHSCAKMLASVWMGGEPHTDVTRQMEQYILSGGVYGSVQNKVLVQQQKHEGKFGYAMHRIFLPYSQLKHQYPVIGKYRWLTPVMEVWRWFKLIFSGKLKSSIQELSYNQNISQAQANEMKIFLQEIGL